MEDPRRAENRLDNIQAVEPVLSALRTVSQGSLQSARKRLMAVDRYRNELLDLTTWLPNEVNTPLRTEESSEERNLLVVLGSDRGLCGSFNTDLLEKLDDILQTYQTVKNEVDIWALGFRLAAKMKQRGITPKYTERFTRRAIPSFKQAHRLGNRMLEKFASGYYGEILILLNQEESGSRLQTSTESLLPVKTTSGQEEKGVELWPPPIIETPPEGLLAQISKQVAVIKFYSLLLVSSAAEHGVRYRLLENATQNIENLTEELELEIQRARQEAITAEMIELASSAGLINT